MVSKYSRRLTEPEFILGFCTHAEKNTARKRRSKLWDSCTLVALLLLFWDFL